MQAGFTEEGAEDMWRRMKLSRLRGMRSGVVKDGFKTLVKWENSI